MYRLTLLLLLLPSLAHGQEVKALAEMPSAQQVQSAQDTIKKAQSAPTNLAVGGYALVSIELTTKLTRYTVPGGDDCLRTILIPKGATYEGWLRTKGDAELKWTVIAPDPKFDRLLVTGIIKGTSTVVWMTVKGDEAVVVAAFQFVVDGGTPKPPDLPPVDDPLTQALRVAANADYKAGKSDKKILLPLAGIYSAAGNDTLATIATVGALDERLYQARVALGIPDPEAVYPTLRKAIQAEIYSKLGVDNSSAARPLTDDMKRQAKAVFLRVAASLEAIAQ